MYDENGNQLSIEEVFKTTDEYKNIQEQVHRLQPQRLAVFKQYWRKFKNNKSRREWLVKALDNSDKQMEFYYGEGFKPWRDEVEGVHEFLESLEAKKKETDK